MKITVKPTAEQVLQLPTLLRVGLPVELGSALDGCLWASIHDMVEVHSDNPVIELFTAKTYHNNDDAGFIKQQSIEVGNQDISPRDLLWSLRDCEHE